MKKLSTVLLLLCLLLSLAACGKKPASTDTGSATQAAKTEAGTNQTEAATDTEPKTEPDTEPDTEPVPDTPALSFEEITVVDNDDCLIRITGIDAKNFWGYTLNVYLENKSSDKKYRFSVDGASINGVSAEPLFSKEVAAGKKAMEEISFMDDSLPELLGDFTDIMLAFRVHDADDWTADDIVTETVHVYPFGEENAVRYVRQPQDTDTVIVDNDDLTVIVTGYDPDSLWGYSVNLYLVNKTDKALMFSVDDASVNGLMSDPFFATTVEAGTSAFSQLSWSDSEFEKNGITEVEEIEMNFRVHDADDWGADNLFEETVKLNP